MNKEEFLKKLEELLLDVDKTERQEAIQYYEEYFQDSEKAEAEVIRELGSPEEVAHNIREELAEKEIVLASTENKEKNQNCGEAYESKKSEKEKKEMEPGVIVLIVLAAIFLGIPIGIPIIASAFGLVLGILGVLLGIVLATAICFIVFGITAIICFIVSIVKMFSAPLAGVIILGLSLLLLGLCFLCALITWKMCSVVIPNIVKGIIYLCKLPFRKGATA